MEKSKIEDNQSIDLSSSRTSCGSKKVTIVFRGSEPLKSSDPSPTRISLSSIRSDDISSSMMSTSDDGQKKFRKI